ncbi:hypothetical protein I6N95_18010 [Vagococcus sp. BWB3-3]|uniref:ATP-binding cassette domain-containing protein n=1 Tax=Vagococcus allomyrinae TaxID=2794353 RepID=A0A940SY08_9ENTE|nr:hypothetical protein [Vagococcus allomyrinae]MBP1042913.1 hypothetical protein [Vagococcus allomyrinae]
MKIQIKSGEFKISGNVFLVIENDHSISNGLYKLSGANGSGKTLFLEYLSGFRKTGNIVTNIDPKKILYLGESGIGIEDLTIIENIKLTYWIFGAKLTDVVMANIKSLYSDEQLNKIYSQSSFGMQLMVGLSLIFSEIEWQLIVLDETLAGVDETNKLKIINEIIFRKSESVIFLVSHEHIKEKIEYEEVYIFDKKLQFKQ